MIIETKGEDKRRVRYRLRKEFARVRDDGSRVELVIRPNEIIKPAPLNRHERRRRAAAERIVREEIAAGVALPGGLTADDCLTLAKLFALTIEDMKTYESA